MPSAKIVAQKPFGRVISPLSAGQAAFATLADVVWLNLGVAQISCKTSARPLAMIAPTGQPGFIERCTGLLLSLKQHMRLQGPIGTPVMRNGSCGGPLAAGSKRCESCPSATHAVCPTLATAVGPARPPLRVSTATL